MNNTMAAQIKMPKIDIVCLPGRVLQEQEKERSQKLKLVHPLFRCQKILCIVLLISSYVSPGFMFIVNAAYIPNRCAM